MVNTFEYIYLDRFSMRLDGFGKFCARSYLAPSVPSPRTYPSTSFAQTTWSLAAVLLSGMNRAYIAYIYVNIYMYMYTYLLECYHIPRLLITGSSMR